MTPPSRLPAAVATSSTMPSRMLISCLPVRPADTELDVAITVVRLIAAAACSGKLSPRFRNGTRKMPPPMPEQRAEAAGDRAGDENDQRQRAA